jgi:hypothetical protein
MEPADNGSYKPFLNLANTVFSAPHYAKPRLPSETGQMASGRGSSLDNANHHSPLNFVNPPRHAGNPDVKSPTGAYPDVVHSKPNDQI